MLPTTLWFEDLVGDATPARAPREEALREIHLPHRLIPNTVVSSEAGRSLSSGVKVAPLDDDADEDLGLRVDEGCEYRSSQMRPYRDVHEDLAPHRRHQTESSRSSAGDRSTDGAVEDCLAESLPESVYVWACGEKLRPQDDDVTVSEIAIGWLTLMAQVVAYIILIRYARPYEGASYSIYSVFLAMFLMVSTSASDIRAGYALLFRGSSHARRIFGGLLLTSVALLVVASLRVLFMEAENNAELVIGATIVLFIEDVDNKLMLFMIGVPQGWRLFWMLEVVGISFWLALAGVHYLGESDAVSSYFAETGLNLEDVMPWYFVMVYTPGAVTLWSLVVNFAVARASRAYRDTPEETPEAPSSCQSGTARFVRMLVRVSKAEPSFTVALALWFVFCSIFSSALARKVWEQQAEGAAGGFWGISSGVDYVIIGSACVSLACFLVGLSRAVLGAVRGVAPTRPRRRWYPLFIGWGVGSAVGVGFNYCTLPGSGCPPYIPWGFSLAGSLCGVLLFAEQGLLERTLGGWIRRPIRILRRADSVVCWSLLSGIEFMMVWWIARVKSKAWLDIFFVNH